MEDGPGRDDDFLQKGSKFRRGDYKLKNHKHPASWGDRHGIDCMDLMAWPAKFWKEKCGEEYQLAKKQRLEEWKAPLDCKKEAVGQINPD